MASRLSVPIRTARLSPKWILLHRVSKPKKNQEEEEEEEEEEKEEGSAF